MINAAKRPVLYLGGGAINAADEIRQFAEKANLPTTMTLMALGMLPKAHPLSWDAGHARRAQHQLHPARGGFADCYGRAF
jgi:thiamine pyrophosphate-dependent acetolactate synthase large subunit-like protein